MGLTCSSVPDHYILLESHVALPSLPSPSSGADDFPWVFGTPARALVSSRETGLWTGGFSDEGHHCVVRGGLKNCLCYYATLSMMTIRGTSFETQEPILDGGYSRPLLSLEAGLARNFGVSQVPLLQRKMQEAFQTVLPISASGSALGKQYGIV